MHPFPTYQFGQSHVLTKWGPQNEFPRIPRTKTFSGNCTETLIFPEFPGSSRFRIFGAPFSASWGKMKLICGALLTDIPQLFFDNAKTYVSRFCVQTMCRSGQSQENSEMSKDEALFLTVGTFLLTVELLCLQSFEVVIHSGSSVKTPLFQQGLKSTGADPCAGHHLDHGVVDPECDFCKSVVRPLHRHWLKGSRHLPLFVFDFAGPYPAQVDAISTYSLVCGAWVTCALLRSSCCVE